MWAVVSSWDGNTGEGPDAVWVYPTREDAIKGLENLWEQSYNLALDDEEFDEDDDQTWHEEEHAQVFWKGHTTWRHFNIVEVMDREELI